MSETVQLLNLIEGLGDARVLCVGDVMLDRFVYGDVSRISPEAPVPVCRVVNESAMLGGAGTALLMALVVVPALFAIWRKERT